MTRSTSSSPDALIAFCRLEKLQAASGPTVRTAAPPRGTYGSRAAFSPWMCVSESARAGAAGSNSARQMIIRAAYGAVGRVIEDSCFSTYTSLREIAMGQDTRAIGQI